MSIRDELPADGSQAYWPDDEWRAFYARLYGTPDPEAALRGRVNGQEIAVTRVTVEPPDPGAGPHVPVYLTSTMRRRLLFIHYVRPDARAWRDPETLYPPLALVVPGSTKALDTGEMMSPTATPKGEVQS